MKRILLTILLMISSLTTVGDEVLLWMYNDPDIYDWADGNYYKADTLVGRGEAEGLKANAVRISASDKDGNIVYLNLSDARWGYDSGDAWLIPDDWDGYKAGPGFAHLDVDKLGYLSSPTEISFAMELGFAEFGDNFNIVSWKVLAAGSDTYQNLFGGGKILESELSYHGDMAWTPGMVVPEPNSGILILVGSCFLMLLRPKINRGYCI